MTTDTQLYYIQDSRQYVGNSVLWWRKGGSGYTTDITDAEVFDSKGAERLVRMEKNRYKAWRKDHVDTRIRQHVDAQYLDRSYRCFED
jgi:hypothetical protein